MPEAAKNYSITELEMCQLAMNIAMFSHLLKKVDFMFETNFLWNRIDFLEEHKLLPILLIWLHLGVWENVFPAQTPGFVGV